MRDELVVARVRTAHGVRGELKVESLSGETAHLVALSRVILVRGEERHEMAVEWVRGIHRAVLMKLVGVDSPEAAKRWRGWEISVPRDAASPLGDDEYYFADLVGLRVIFESCERGVVSSVMEGGRTALLELTLPGGEKRLVPFQAEFISQVDREGGNITLTTDEVIE